jgi:hypothetical protein
MARVARRRWPVLLAVLAVPPATSRAEEGGGLTAHGFVLADYAVRTTGKRIPGSPAADFVFAEEGGRLDLALTAPTADSEAQLRLDAFHDAVIGRTDLAVREMFLDHRAGRLDVRLGRQILTWGVGDLAFINDVFPKDYGAFFVGRPIEYLKVPSDGLRATVALAPLSVDLVVLPFFAPDRPPPADRFSYGLVPFPGVTPQTVELPERSLANTELAARVSGSLGPTDLAVYAYRGFFHAPFPRLLPGPTLALSFPPLAVYGASVQRNLLGGVVSAEAGYFDSRQRRSGAAPPSSARWLAGFQRDAITDFTVGVQYVAELTFDGTAPAAPASYKQTVTLRATGLALNQTLRLSLLAVWGVSERDLLIIPEVLYQVHDRLALVLGLNLFGGTDASTTFGTFRDDANVYTWSRFTF